MLQIFFTVILNSDFGFLPLSNTNPHHPEASKKVLSSGADPGFGVRGDEIRQGDLRVLLLLSQMFMERMMQEN